MGLQTWFLILVWEGLDLFSLFYFPILSQDRKTDEEFTGTPPPLALFSLDRCRRDVHQMFKASVEKYVKMDLASKKINKWEDINFLEYY